MTEDDLPDGMPDPFDLSAYVPFYLSAIANRWTSSSSRIYHRKFGIGIVEWRVLAALAALGPASSLDVINLVGLDPASASKAVRKLEQLGAVTPLEGRFAGRTKPYRLTEIGAGMFRGICDIALQRERMLLKPLTETEQTMFLHLLHKLHDGMSDFTETEET